MFTELMVLFILIVLNAFFAASEIALISLNDNKIKAMAETGNKRAKLLHNLLNEPSRFLATIQIGITLAGFLASAFAAGSFAGQLANYLFNLGVPLSEKVLETISIVLITIFLSFFTLVVGELVPKRLAMQKAEAISMFAAVPLTILSKISAPFVALLTVSTNGILRIFGIDPHKDDDNVTEEEIRMMVDVGEENGSIQSSEKVMINNILEFDNKLVSEIMTHRTNVVGISLETEFKEVVKLINTEQYTRYPVYSDGMDNIVGILHVKDILQFMESGDGQTFSLKEMMRTPYFVLGSRKTDDLFLDLQKGKVHMAVVIDEYGGTDGIVTIEDLIEEIVGNIFDEYDEQEEENEINKLDDNTFLMDGTVSLYDVRDTLKIELPVSDYDTLSGFVIGQLGNIPVVEDKSFIEYNGIIFNVEQVDEKRITKIKVEMNHMVEAS
ncbi:HlyC/CorC family transporter [Bacillus luteolus]|uniref:HlyC/CorC family transporter n=1 Tax=Litchfieldia luteola TaxID=682179 RepID=A0ABR9QM62_9BACI|nr:hemolysin family protein [Cytobacillus luteolus]MBE4909592.1 HlyC/CorC family transporter [Cytobacillus luteolus]MBP1940993.1 putative hemolysin [Cytobacillus luteolus]